MLRYAAWSRHHYARPDGGSGIVLIGGKPAARVGDIVMEPGALIPLPPPNNIVVGEFTVLIGMGGGGAPCPDGTPD